jgi:hypothetical protein
VVSSVKVGAVTVASGSPSTATVSVAERNTL